MATKNPYNGFTGVERDDAWKVQLAARASGAIRWNLPCAMCGVIDPNAMPHLEDYRKPMEFYPLCIECHMRLHARFKNPTAWVRHLALLAAGRRPRVWHSVGEYFKCSKWVEYPEYKPVSPLNFGSRWYHQLALVPVDLRRVTK